MPVLYQCDNQDCKKIDKEEDDDSNGPKGWHSIQIKKFDPVSKMHIGWTTFWLCEKCFEAVLKFIHVKW